MRFVAGAQVKSEFDIKRKIALKGQGDLSFSLAEEGTVTSLWSLPDKEGFDLFYAIELVAGADDKKQKALGKYNEECRLCFTATAKGKAFAGASIAQAWRRLPVYTAPGE